MPLQVLLLRVPDRGQLGADGGAEAAAGDEHVPAGPRDHTNMNDVAKLIYIHPTPCPHLTRDEFG